MKKVILLPTAAKGLRKHRADAARIVAKINAYAADPAAQANNVKALRGSDEFRLRVGDYRVIFVDREQEIIVKRIGPRGSIYD
ncbi:type II toxin-antitoxin system RelE family toxin [Mesorhizobium xinjiangense]|uniref:type II toxin-antitoxin system RelE family toxin n=1 Tax=Mesorhizobium xinjiangense TaxID=2678685 RepID=UPI0012ED1783|nr:type II toxin-antitoxin system RelE/ParE family toxin [Mesorhizobium xinjiangense]